MAEAQNIVYEHREITQLMLKDQGIDSGHWAIYLTLKFKAGNIDEEGVTQPAGVVMVTGVGLQRVPEDMPLAVDASKIGRKKTNARRKVLAGKS